MSEPTDYPISTIYDAAGGTITYSPKSVTIPVSPSPATISVTITTVNPGAGGDATFYGFAIQAGWVPALTVQMTSTTITITDPNTEEDPLPGTFGFVTLVQAPEGALPASQNPDPTIYNEPIGATTAQATGSATGGDRQAA